MRTIKRRRIVALLISLTAGTAMYAIPGVASADTSAMSATIAVTPTDWSTTVVIPQFDPSLGTLDEVSLVIEASLQGSIFAENVSTSSGCDVTARLLGEVTVVAGAATLAVPLSTPAQNASLGPFDGSFPPDFGGASGAMFDGLSSSGSIGASITDPGDLPAWTGTGDLVASAEGTATSDYRGCGNEINGFTAEAGTTITVTYSFTPALVGGEGCTPGYWKQKHHAFAWTDYARADVFSDVFGAGPDLKLIKVLRRGGGKEKAMGRHAVAALLNATNDDVGYALSATDVITIVQSAYATGDFRTAKDLLEHENEQGCDLGNGKR